MASDLPDFDTLACLDRSWRITDLHHAAQRARGASRRRSSAAGVTVRAQAIRLAELPANRILAIAVTAYATLRERDEALNAGYNSHLAKPVEAEQLIAAVAAVRTAARAF